MDSLPLIGFFLVIFGEVMLLYLVAAIIIAKVFSYITDKNNWVHRDLSPNIIHLITGQS